MYLDGPVIIIDDDIDDIEIYTSIFKELGYKNTIEAFQFPSEALQFLRDTKEKPFLILCDVNMPQLDGYQLRNTIAKDEFLLAKCIPFLLITTGVTPADVKKAYILSAQGIFAKPYNLSDWRDMIREIMVYWRRCLAPSHTN